MPEEKNVELVRDGFEKLAEGGVEAMLDFVHPEFEVTTPQSLASEPGTYRGHDGLRRYFDSFYEAMDEVRFEPHELTAVGDRVVADFTLHARGRTTGLEAEQRAFMLWTLKDDKAYRLELFTDRDEAIAAASE